jgi:5-methylcytosine-specific restriction endonuclease McrA
MPKVKRKSIPQKLRAEIFKKYDGHCAYCGKELTQKGWQVDHLIPVQRERFGRATEFEVENFNNFMPSCRRCNHYKRAHSLETFRRYIEEIPEKLQDSNYIYKVGLDYGLIEEHPRKIVFYFEAWELEHKDDYIIG